MLRSYLNDMPYCDTASKPLFQTSVTSQALVAESRQERKAETALPPTEHTRWVSASSSSPADMASVGMVVVVVVREERDFRLPISASARYSCPPRSVGRAKGVNMSATCRCDEQGGVYLAHVPESMRSRGVLGAIAARSYYLARMRRRRRRRRGCGLTQTSSQRCGPCGAWVGHQCPPSRFGRQLARIVIKRA